jgi:hypothetical protein
MRHLVVLFLLILSANAYCQNNDLKDPDYFLKKNETLPKVFLVGTFHFNYPNLDAHKTDADKQVNVLSDEKQKELEELLDYISIFKPTIIAVEAWNTSNVNGNYRKYLNNNFQLGKNEIYQIGFRLAKKFNLDSLALVDAAPMLLSIYDGKDSVCVRPWLDSIYKDWDFRSDNKFSRRYQEWYSYSDSIELQLSFLEVFKYMNSDKNVIKGYGAYLTGDFENGEFDGADALAMHWYSRNLRIFRNIQKLNAKPEDRILVLYGAGHMGILKQLFESSPEFELVPFNSLDIQK